MHDFVDEAGKVAPYGVYDLQQNEAWVSVGISHDTAEFAVETVRTWWNEMGAAAYPHATSLVITADGGGSNGYRLRLWKLELQASSTSSGFPVTVCHLPAGHEQVEQDRTSPVLVHHPELARQAARHAPGDREPHRRHDDEDRPLRPQSARSASYAKGRRVSDAQLAAVHLDPHAFHGEWNYTIHPTGTAYENDLLISRQALRKLT